MAPAIDTAHAPTTADRNAWLRWLRAAADEFVMSDFRERDRFGRALLIRSAHTPVAVLRNTLRSLGYDTPAANRPAITQQIVMWWHTMPADQRIPADEIATDAQRRELANTIAQIADAIAEDRVVGPVYAAVHQLQTNVARLVAWTPDDRA